MRIAVDLPLAEIAEICRRYDVAELSLFGSVAKGEFGPDSDYDFLIVFKYPLQTGLFKYADVQFALEELLGSNVDLVPKNGLKPIIRDEVLASARIIYAAE